jgi:hypothetical protein
MLKENIMARYRLLAAAQIDGALHAAGSIVEKAEDWIGPHCAHVPHAETLAEGGAAPGHDQPLYERLPDEEDAVEVDAGTDEEAKAAAEAALAYGVTSGA